MAHPQHELRNFNFGYIFDQTLLNGVPATVDRLLEMCDEIDEYDLSDRSWLEVEDQALIGGEFMEVQIRQQGLDTPDPGNGG